MAKKLTNAQLIDQLIQLRDQYEVLERAYAERDDRCNAATQRVADLERQLSETQDAHQSMVANRNKLVAQREAGQVAGQHVPHASYWDYVKARKELARARGWRVATYKPRAEWEAAVAAYHAGAH